jgi:guanylate kinase
MKEKNKLMKPGLAVVISSPSGTGKTTICHALIKRNADYQFSVSATSRELRGNEKNGVDYWFLNKNRFLAGKKTGMFIETTDYLGNCYGTPRKPLEKAISEGKVILLDIDIRGGFLIKKAVPQAVTIFIVPPSLSELKRRLIGRRTESVEIQKRRLKEATTELKRWNRYDYVVVNDELRKAVIDVERIIEAERRKTSRLTSATFWTKSLHRPLGLLKKGR